MNSWWVCLSSSLLHNQKHNNLRAQKLTHNVYKWDIITIDTWCWLFSTLMQRSCFKLLGLKSNIVIFLFDVTKRITLEENLTYTKLGNL